MFNINGELVGISSYIISESGGFQGIGFAATSNVAKKLVLDGNRRWTGINGYLLDKKKSWLLNVPIEGGLLVQSVVRFSPADYAGLKGGFTPISIDGEDLIVGGDIILAINDFPITQSTIDALLDSEKTALQDMQQQKSFRLKVLRGGRIEIIDFEFKK